MNTNVIHLNLIHSGRMQSIRALIERRLAGHDRRFVETAIRHGQTAYQRSPCSVHRAVMIGISQAHRQLGDTPGPGTAA